VSATSGKAERVGAFPDRAGPAGCDLAARTSSIVCSLVFETSDAWVMQNFDPDLP
jgi:hypothetical protein